jgi:large subunit ribosomal protein L21
MKKAENNIKNVSILPLKKETQIVLDRYAIIETGGKQYFALEGKTIQIEKLNEQPGEQVVFSTVLFKRIDSQNCIVGTPYVDTPVTGTIVKHLRGDKIVVFKFKRRKKYRKKQGHRQSYTVIRINSI